MRRRRPLGWALIATVALFVLQTPRLGAHDMPSDVLVLMYARPTANQL